MPKFSKKIVPPRAIRKFCISITKLHTDNINIKLNIKKKENRCKKEIPKIHIFYFLYVYYIRTVKEQEQEIRIKNISI